MKKSLLITSGANESPFPFRRESWGEFRENIYETFRDIAFEI